VSSPKRTIHILFKGYTICGFPGMPAAWPQGHVWLSKADYPTATEREVMDCCARCEAVFRERWPKEVRRVILKPQELLEPPSPSVPEQVSDLEIATRLWQLLDDIDTLDDSCRDNDALFRERVREIQKRRHLYLTSLDGQTLERVKK